ncbi:hypothetical protein [Opitutus sp. ER46]|uniref:hypothetical protein n=1 Tax=Opitutus sp. ER46 TaxID=2161864 RepID=UPI0011B28EC2|nr:hypothetical protein [Opitutus sp. ER46]
MDVSLAQLPFGMESGGNLRAFGKVGELGPAAEIVRRKPGTGSTARAWDRFRESAPMRENGVRHFLLLHPGTNEQGYDFAFRGRRPTWLPDCDDSAGHGEQRIQSTTIEKAGDYRKSGSAPV